MCIGKAVKRPSPRHISKVEERERVCGMEMQLVYIHMGIEGTCAAVCLLVCLTDYGI